MSEDLNKLIEQTTDLMKKAISHLESELGKIRAGRANPMMLDSCMVDYYGNPTPISQVANISVADARTLTLQPWEKNMLGPIERSIMAANLGVTPQNDGIIIRLYLPPLTEERRREIVKRVGGEVEFGKVAVRNIRRDAIEGVKKLKKDGLSEDAAKDGEAEIQDLTNKNIALIEKTLESKEKEIMSV
jgi:ribosome recycling factor